MSHSRQWTDPRHVEVVGRVTLHARTGRHRQRGAFGSARPAFTFVHPTDGRRQVVICCGCIHPS